MNLLSLTLNDIQFILRERNNIAAKNAGDDHDHTSMYQREKFSELVVDSLFAYINEDTKLGAKQDSNVSDADGRLRTVENLDDVYEYSQLEDLAKVNLSGFALDVIDISCRVQQYKECSQVFSKVKDSIVDVMMQSLIEGHLQTSKSKVLEMGYQDLSPNEVIMSLAVKISSQSGIVDAKISRHVVSNNLYIECISDINEEYSPSYQKTYPSHSVSHICGEVKPILLKSEALVIGTTTLQGILSILSSNDEARFLAQADKFNRLSRSNSSRTRDSDREF